MRRAGALAVLALAACSRSPGASPDRSRLVADWSGSDTGRLVTHATAEWCDSLRMLEVRAVKGDTGLALALFPVDSVRPDSYPAVPGARADSVRPSSAVALRWFAETAIKGFQGESGEVIVEASDSQRVWGRFEARLRSITEGGRLEVKGSFFDVPIVAAKRGCVGRESAAAAEAAESADTI
jgi:hypothetical protein